MDLNFYEECVREKYGWSSYSDEHGFFNYTSDGDLIIREFWIKPESRANIKVYRGYLRIMEELAWAKDCQNVVISVYMDAKNDLKENTLALALRSGFRLSHLEAGQIVLKRQC